MVDKQNFPNSSRRADLLFLAANRERENTIQTDQTPHSRHRTTSTPFPRRQESTPSSAIPAKAGIHPVIRHSREGGNPQFPRTREFNENTIQTDQTPHSCTGPPQRHSRAGRNPPHRPSFPQGGNPPHRPSFPRRRESTPLSVIPAKAGIHNSRERGNSTKTPSRLTRHLIPAQDHLNAIPAQAGIHPIVRHSRDAREWRSVIPAQAGIHNSRERGNSTKTPSRLTRHLIPAQDHLNVFPAQAGIHPIVRHSRMRGNDGVFFPALREWDDEFPHAGIVDSRIRGNDGHSRAGMTMDSALRE